MNNTTEDRMKTQELFEGWVTLQEAEAITNIRTDKLRKLIRAGRLDSFQPTGSYSPHLVRAKNLKSLVNSC